VPTITLTIQIEVPEGAIVAIKTSGESTITDGGLPTEVQEAVDTLVPARFRPWVMLYLERCAAELGCQAEVPTGNRHNYLNVFPPARCRRARVAAITYTSSRTAIYCGPRPLAGYDFAEETYNSGEYAYPKLPVLESEKAVNEAVELTKLAIHRLER
jgi:hypothetical protein